MRNRISRVVTRTGDCGETSLAGPERLPKHHPRLELIGALDEANSFIGLLAAAISEHHSAPQPVPSAPPVARPRPPSMEQPPQVADAPSGRLFHARLALTRIQSRLFDIGGAVATGGTDVDWQPLVAEIEAETRKLNRELPLLREFVLPGGDETVARAHVARSAVRRAERAFWAEAPDLSAVVEAGAGAYLNRLSDYFFVLARTAAREGGVDEVVWEPLGRE